VGTRDACVGRVIVPGSSNKWGEMQGAEMDRQTADLELVRLCLALEAAC